METSVLILEKLLVKEKRKYKNTKQFINSFRLLKGLKVHEKVQKSNILRLVSLSLILITYNRYGSS